MSTSPTPYLIDSHAHLDMLKSPVEEVLARAKEKSVQKIIHICTSSSLEAYSNTIVTINKYDNIFGAIAFHPQDADKFQNTKPLEKYFDNQKIIAVGECGLDFYRDWSDFNNQERLFRYTINVARELKKTLIVHNRCAGDKTLQIIKEERASEVGGVFHCYAEDAEYAKKIADLGFKVSFTGVVTFKNASKINEVISNIPIEQMLVETDCPFMAPEPFRGKECEPMHVYYVAEKIAEIKGISFNDACQIFTKNTEKLFGI